MKNQLHIGDNLPIMLGMPDEFADLIYLDPPFNSRTFRKGKTEKHSFNDTWTKREIDAAHAINLQVEYPQMWQVMQMARTMHSPAMQYYLEFMAPRLVLIHRLLKPTGSVYLHCDPAANFYLRILMDNIFGAKYFRNEIVWAYGKVSNAKAKKFLREHDTILFYSKTNKFSYNEMYEDAVSPRKQQLIRAGYNTKNQNGLKYIYIYNEQNLAKKEAAGKINRHHFDRIVYVDPNQGNRFTDVFRVDILNNMSEEYTGYATQKPLALLNRIVAASSNVGDMVFDPFCGCATACVSAAHLQRNFIGVDQNKLALEILQDRLADTTYGYETKIPGEAKLEKPVRPKLNKKIFPDAMTPAQAKPILVARDVAAFGYTICKGCLDKHDVTGKNLTVDHKVAKDVGGPDRLKNYQLFCTPCNSGKGNMPMEKFLAKLAAKNVQERLQIRQRLAKVEKQMQ